MKIGFTGTQTGLTKKQISVLLKLFKMLENKFDEFHHGDCIGADEAACYLAEDKGAKIICHPPSNPSKRCNFDSDEYRSEKAYLDRNHDIVDESDLLIGCSGTPNEVLRSGTWATIRYAKKRKKPVIIIYPDGTAIKPK